MLISPSLRRLRRLGRVRGSDWRCNGDVQVGNFLSTSTVFQELLESADQQSKGDQSHGASLRRLRPPFVWYERLLGASSSEICLYDVGQVDIQVAAAKSTSKRQQRLVFGDSSGDVANGKYPRGNKSLKATYDIGFEGVINKPPVHETIAIAAFILSKKPMPKGTNYHNLNDKQWEYVRGLVWNDDPLCYLFDDYSKNNHDFSNGIAWYDCYRNGPPSCMIRRSHYGDLQFLHAMGSSLDEEPAETLRKLLTWFEVLYKLACGNQGVSDTDKLKQNLGEWFNSKTSPTDEATLRELILASTPNYNQTNIQRRALGICLHMIADSYAVGHTQRRLKNPDSYLGRNSAGYMVFKAGMWGDWGAVLNFHCYDGQNSDHHSFYDGLEGASLPVPKDLDSFNSVIGGRNAIDASKQIINFWAEATKWEDGVETYLKMQVFAIDPKATPSNSQVDESGPISWSCRHFACGRRNPGYRTDMERKLASLDAHVSITDRSGFADKWRCLRWRAALFTLSIFILAVILTFVGLRVHMSI